MSFKKNHIIFQLIAVFLFLLFIVACSKDSGRNASWFLENSGIKGGFIACLGVKDGKFTSELYSSDSYRVHGLASDQKSVDNARQYIRNHGKYGNVTVEEWNKENLPYIDNLVNLLIVRESYDVPMKEFMRVLAPNGVLFMQEGDKWIKKKKEWPDNIDEWSHHFHGANNNAVSHDTRVGPPRHLQWVGNPLYARSHELNSSIPAMVTSGGRIFYILDEGPIGMKDPRLPSEWKLIARNGFNGVKLWNRNIENWGWRQWNKEYLEGKDWLDARGLRTRFPNELHRRLVSDGERVYVTLGYRAPVSILEASTGKTMKTIKKTSGTEEIIHIDGKLILRINNEYREDSISASDSLPESIMAVDAGTGEVLWEQPEDKLVPLTLAANNGRVHYGVSGKVKTLNLSTGEEEWESKIGVEKLVVYQERVYILYAPGEGGWSPKRLIALDSETGEELWKGPESEGNNLFVAGNLVWYGRPRQKYHTDDWLAAQKDTLQTIARAKGYDPVTGEVKKRIRVKNLITPGHHYRCYPSKATDRYLMWNKRGVEFMDIKENNHMRNNWVRGPCKLGLMPANGLLYAPPHQCFCYPGSTLNGFNVLSANLKTKDLPGQQNRGNKLVEGPAYGFSSDEASSSQNADWPTYRQNHKRSGSTKSQIPVKLNNKWQKKLGGKLTQPVVANGKLYIAQIDQHRVYSIDSKGGDIKWTFTAGGRVDSPPTYYRGRVIFGSHDGWVYCLRADNGKLIWKFRAAPSDRRIIAFNQLESSWPVHGSILIEDDIAYFASGRSSFLDGGICLYGIDPVSGEKQYEHQLEGPFPDIPEDPGRPFDMEGALADVLVSQNDYIYMKDVKFNKSLQRQESPRMTQLGDKHTGLHLFSTSASGLLDDSWWDRSFWMYSERWPGFYMGLNAPKSGQILSFNDSCTYAFKYFTERNVHSPFSRQGQGSLLYADKNSTEPILVDTTGRPEPVKWLPQVKHEWADFRWQGWKGLEYNAPAKNYEKGPGFSRSQPTLWQQWVPLRVRSMVLADNVLFIAGPPDVIDPEDPLAAYKGEKGMHLWAISPTTGEKISGYKLSSAPIFDGMAAANNHLYISTIEGNIICLGGG